MADKARKGDVQVTVFQQRLMELIEEKKIKAADIARGTGLSPAAISKYLSDEKKQPEFIPILKIAKFLDVSVEWLGGSKDKREPFEVPKILPIYEALSFEGKNKVYDFASYLLKNETEGDKNEE